MQVRPQSEVRRLSDKEVALLHQFRHEPHRIGWLMGKKLLGPLHSKWIKEVWDPTIHTALQGHRGSYKTTAITVVGTVYWLLFHPNARIAICRKTKTDAEDTVTAIRTAFRLPAIRELFKIAHGSYPEFVTEKADCLTFTFKSDSGTIEGNVNAYGVASALTGRHFDKILCDDIVGREDRYSTADREKARRFYEELVTNIIDPWGQVMHAGTPWHKLDAWQLYEEMVKQAIGAPMMVYDCYSTNILQPEQLEKKRRTTTPSLFAANYLLKHQADENALFNDPHRDYWHNGIYEPVHAHIDAAFGGDHMSGFSIIQDCPALGHKQVYMDCWEGHIQKHYETIIKAFKEYRVTHFHMEQNADKGFTGREIMQLARDAGLSIVYDPYHEWQNKTMKISTVGKYHWDNLYFTFDTDQVALDQVCDWQEGAEPDDVPDSLTSNLRQAYGLIDDSSDLINLLQKAYG